MSIKKKTILVTIIALACLMVVLNTSMSLMIRQTFKGIEHREACDGAKHGALIIANALTAMDKRIYDWAVWDDAYDFAQNGNQQFVDSNLGAETMSALGFNFLLFYNDKGKLVRGECVDVVSSKYVPMPDDLREAVERGTNLLVNKSAQDTARGLVLTEKGPVLIAKRPITHSSGKGPVGGTLIVAKYLNKEVLASLSTEYAVSLDAQPSNASSKPQDYVQAEQLLSDGKVKEAVIPRTEDSISAYTVLNDVGGKPAIILRVDSARVIYAQSKVMMRYATIGVLLAGILFGLLNLFWLNRIVLKPLARLDNYVETALADLGLR